MTKSLEETLRCLESIMEPPTSYTQGTVVFYPNAEDSGPAAELKRRIWDMCFAVICSGKAWLVHHTQPGDRMFSGTESDAIESVLANDADRQSFQEAVLLAQTAENLLYDCAT